MTLLRQFENTCRTVSTTAALCRRIVPFWHPGYPLALLQARRLCSRNGFEPAEAFRLGLFRRHVRRLRQAEYVSRHRLKTVQQSLNPIAWSPLFSSKDLFYRYSVAVETPTPRLFAVFQPDMPGWTYTGHPLRTRAEWRAFFADNLPREFVVRPAEHAAGRRACFFYREGDAFIGAAMARLDAGELYDWLASDHTVRHVIQERLYCHPELTRLSGEESLQPVRIITLIDNDGQVHILHAHLKILRTDETTDPRDGGLAGGIEAPIDLRHGVLEKANRIPGTGAPAVTVGSHPRTGVAFEGFRVPFWTELCRLARHAALKFIPVRTIGWDVALTSDGPIILEGDLWWEPPNQHGDMAEIFRVLSDPSLPRIQRSESVPADGDHWRNLFTADDRA